MTDEDEGDNKESLEEFKQKWSNWSKFMPEEYSK